MNEKYLVGLSLKIKRLDEKSQLLFLLNNEEGLVRLIVPSSDELYYPTGSILPFCLLRVYINGNTGLRKVRQINILRNFSAIVKNLDTLSAAQGLVELSIHLLSEPIMGMEEELLLQLTRLEVIANQINNPIEALAIAVQSSIHQLMIAGCSIPIQSCALTGKPLTPPLDNSDSEWYCSFVIQEGFILRKSFKASIELNASEFALLQKLQKPNIPRSSNGELIGSQTTWLRLLDIVCLWVEAYLPCKIFSFSILRDSLELLS
uniref:Recombination protein O (RecO) n=1 Tax=Paulinella longichromatophora TaxID=1708747 RepID=A0A2H4ZQJ5_9EUKA|nr:Recombination protein O (RecO) [Paulinella longichromatophora]